MMGEDFRNRLKDGLPTPDSQHVRASDPVGVIIGGVAGWEDEDGLFEPDDPANDPSQEYTFVRDHELV